jgi:hypothetical protein
VEVHELASRGSRQQANPWGRPMWVSQSYLTNLTADGAAAAYFLFESYRDDHLKVEQRIRPKLAQLALGFGDAAHVFVPTDEDRGSIEKEFNDWISRRGLQGMELPGILVLDRMMNDERAYRGSAIFISLSSLINEPWDADRLLGKVKEAIQGVSSEMKMNKLGLERALENIQLRPGFWGMGYDFKPHLMKLVRKLRTEPALRDGVVEIERGRKANGNTGKTKVKEPEPNKLPPVFDLPEAHKLILADRALPAAWQPLIVTLDFSRESLSNLAPLAGLPSLQRLTLSNTPVADLAPLEGLTALQSLWLDGTQVRDLAPLAGLIALEVLDLDDTLVSDLAPLAGLSALQRLTLNNTRVNDLAPLAGLTALQRLTLNNTRVADLAPLAGLTALQLLWLDGTQVSDLAPLASHTSLQSLWLDGTQVRDLASLAGLQKLMRVSVESTARRTDLARTLGTRGEIVKVSGRV